jgi:hypothetical protein
VWKNIGFFFEWHITFLGVACSYEIGIDPYFQPLLVRKPSIPFGYIMIINVEACLVCNEQFYFYDLCTTSCGHTYHPWCLVVHTISSKKCRAINCDEVFHKGLCSSFGLSKLVVEAFGLVTKVEDTRDNVSLQQTPSSQIIQTCMKSKLYFNLIDGKTFMCFLLAIDSIAKFWIIC